VRIIRRHFPFPNGVESPISGHLVVAQGHL
jgi:hypothetical protein